MRRPCRGPTRPTRKGRYRFEGVQAGTYVVTVSAKGFQEATSTEIVLVPGQGVTRDSTVEWGLAIPVNSRNRENAIAFISSLLGPTGRAALMAYGPPPMPRSRVSRADFSVFLTCFAP